MLKLYGMVLFYICTLPGPVQDSQDARDPKVIRQKCQSINSFDSIEIRLQRFQLQILRILTPRFWIPDVGKLRIIKRLSPLYKRDLKSKPFSKINLKGETIIFESYSFSILNTSTNWDSS